VEEFQLSEDGALHRRPQRPQPAELELRGGAPAPLVLANIAPPPPRSRNPYSYPAVPLPKQEESKLIANPGA